MKMYKNELLDRNIESASYEKIELNKLELGLCVCV